MAALKDEFSGVMCHICIHLLYADLYTHTVNCKNQNLTIDLVTAHAVFTYNNKETDRHYGC